MTDAYEEHILGAADVCSNCFRVIRVERVDPVRTGVGTEYEASLERHRQHTSVEYAPADAISEEKGVFCDCGVEGARDRIWSPEDIDRDRFKELLRHVLRTLSTKDVTLKRQETAAYALQAFDDGAGPDAALGQAIDAGIVAAAAQANDQSPVSVR